jgi:hypothetical protein
MEEKYGLIKGMQCLLRKTDNTLFEAISEKRGIGIEDVKSMMQYNMFTINQFSRLTGLTVSVIHNKIRPILLGETYNTDLNFCYPFSDLDNEGLKFIVRDGKSEKLLKELNGIPL